MLITLFACSERRSYVAALDRAIQLMNDNPDSALNILNSLCEHKQEFGKRLLMRHQLHRLNALNKVDSLFHTTEEAQELTVYFDVYGSSNEQMLAYYLLGRAYHDTHEVPMALSSYHTAIERADTTAYDCDYRQLSRVYGQMSNIFYMQDLIKESLKYADISIKYGWKGKDTLNALLSMGNKIVMYKKLHETDSAITLSDKVINLFSQYGYNQIAAGFASSTIRELINKGEFSKAKQRMETYESESGFFDADLNITKGREVYYFTKGLYYLSSNKLDSAEYYFRKELTDGKDFNNQNAGSRGLALLFQKKNIPDSAAKYALYSYSMNDSVYAQMVTSEVDQIQAMYDYTRSQEIARLASERAEKEQNKVTFISLLFLLSAVITGTIARRIYKKQKEARIKYEENISLLAKNQADVIKLRFFGEELSQMITEKEKEIIRLTGEIEAYKEKVGLQKESAETLLQKSDIYAELKKLAAKAAILSDDEWHKIYIMIIDILPNFNKYITSKKLELNDKEFKTIILIRLHFIPKEIANMLDVTPAYITKITNSVMQKLFETDGKTKDLEERLKQFS